MGATEQFKPGTGGLAVSVVGSQNRELGKNFSLGGAAPAAPAIQQGAAVPTHQQAQIGQSNAPKGAQPVSLMGKAPQGQPILGQAVPQGKMPLSPGAQPAPRAALAGPSLDGEVHTIVVEGLAPDGRTYFAEYDAVFPRGTKVMGVTEKMG
jgi:hypothetical protein